MPDLILSVNSNLLKITLITNKGDFRGATRKIPESICEDSTILDSGKFANFVNDLLSEFLPKGKKGCTLNFLIEPENVYSEFIEIQKEENEADDIVVEKAKHQLEGVDINELYFTHNRLAPFVRHFVGVKKIYLEKYIEISQLLGMELRSAIPWTFLLPKFVNELEPSAYIILEEEETVFALAELNSVYFSKTFTKRFKPSELESYVSDLAKHEKTENIKKVFLLGKETLKLPERYELTKISLPNSGIEETKGYEKHLLTHYMMDFLEDLLVSDANALTLLPVPIAVKKPSTVVYAGSGLAIALLLAGVIYGGVRLSKKDDTQLAVNTEPTQEVAGIQNEKEITPVETPKETVTEELKKKDLSIVIENGAGIGGLAGRTKALLEKWGYDVKDIGDSDIVGRQNTLLKFKKDKLKYADLLKEDMKTNFLEIVVQDDLEENADYDLLLIVGTNVDGI